MPTNVDASPTGRNHITTDFGSTALIDTGAGFPAIFIHGVGQSAFFWRFQLPELRAFRRCIAVDLMAHGYTEALPDADVSFREQAKMILAVLDEMNIEHFDLVMNDSGGAVGQLMAVAAPDRVRSMVFSNCDVHDNWPPIATTEMRKAAKEGKFADQVGSFIDHPERFYESFGKLLYENPSFATPEAIAANAAPIISSVERKAAFNRYAGMQDHSQLVEIESDLRKLEIPSLIVWGTGDPFFPVEWAYWLKDALPMAFDVIELEGAMLCFPEERAQLFNHHIAAFWKSLT